MNSSPTMTVFNVSDVAPASKPLIEVPYPKSLKTLLGGRKVEAHSGGNSQFVAKVYFHPLLAAIHLAFNDHRPLCLSPDMIWLLIAQGLANHINANPEQLRPQLVKHQDKLKITLRRDNFIKGSAQNSWPEVFDEFSTAIRQYIGETTHDLLIPTFSTTGSLEKAATEIVLLDAMQSYFEFELETFCGIPQIKLEGTLADWQMLLERSKKLAQFDLDWWINPLIPILEQFIFAVQGKPDKQFWQSIYKFEEVSGGSNITGWIIAFFPYLKNSRTNKNTKKNRPLVEGGKSLQKLMYSFNTESAEKEWCGLSTDSFPSGLAIAPFRWNYFGILHEMEFLGGFIGVKQNSADLFLRPEIGWAVCKARSNKADAEDLLSAEEDESDIQYDEDNDDEEICFEDDDFGVKTTLMSEIMIYLEYSRYEQAEQLIRDAILNNPASNDFKLKLIEVFSYTRNTKGCAEYLEQLKAQGKNADPDFWFEVMSLAHSIIPESPLVAEFMARKNQSQPTNQN